MWIKRVLHQPIRIQRNHTNLSNPSKHFSFRHIYCTTYTKTTKAQTQKPKRHTHGNRVNSTPLPFRHQLNYLPFVPVPYNSTFPRPEPRFRILCRCRSPRWPCRPASRAPSWRLCCSSVVPLPPPMPLPFCAFLGSPGRAERRRFGEGRFAPMLRLLLMYWLIMLPPSLLLSSLRLLRLIVSPLLINPILSLCFHNMHNWLVHFCQFPLFVNVLGIQVWVMKFNIDNECVKLESYCIWISLCCIKIRL